MEKFEPKCDLKTNKKMENLVIWWYVTKKRLGSLQNKTKYSTKIQRLDSRTAPKKEPAYNCFYVNNETKLPTKKTQANMTKV